MDELGRSIVRVSDPSRRKRLAIIAFSLLLIIGAIDFVVGFEYSLLVFYCLPLVVAVTALGWRFGVLTAGAAVGIWLVGDIVGGAQLVHPWVLGWNALMVVCTYLVVIWLFSSVVRLQAEMENRIQQRTAALVTEIANREQLERIVMEISDRERQMIGHELHDGLGQHLTGTAFAAQVLGEKLRDRALPEQKDARQLVSLIDEGIDQTRRLAKGLLLSEIRHDQLVSALQEFAVESSRHSPTEVEVFITGEVTLAESGVATHLFRIVQEAARNAIRHGKASRIEIRLNAPPGSLELAVKDNGLGFNPGASPSAGLGLRIMAHRAQIIGANFSVSSSLKEGTTVSCILTHSHLAHVDNIPAHSHA